MTLILPAQSQKINYQKIVFLLYLLIKSGPVFTPAIRMALLDFINSLQPDDRILFAERCGVSLNYLRQVAYGNRRCRESLAINIERESHRAVVCEALRPDVDWAYLRAGSHRPVHEMAAAGVSHG